MRLASAGLGGAKRVNGFDSSSILLFSPVAVVRLMVGRLSVGICGEGGRKDAGICDGGSNRPVGSDDGLTAVLGEPENGMVNRGRNFALLGSRISRDSMRMASFSERTSVVVEEGEEETKGFSVRRGMILVVSRDYD